MKGATYFDILVSILIAVIVTVTYNILQSSRSENVLENLQSSQYVGDCHFALMSAYGNDYNRKVPIKTKEGSYGELINYYSLPIKKDVKNKKELIARYKKAYYENIQFEDYDGKYGNVEDIKAVCQMYIFDPYSYLTFKKSSGYLVKVKVG